MNDKGEHISYNGPPTTILNKLLLIRSERVNNFCLTLIEQCVLHQHAKMDVYSDSTLKQQHGVRSVGPLALTHYPDSEPTSLCSYTLMLLA